MKKIFFNKIFRKFTEWEFWPTYMFYIPNLPYALYLALRAGKITFFTAVNPAVKNSGDGTESKYKTLSLLDDTYKPVTLFVPAKGEERQTEKILEKISGLGLHFPLIIKPDTGFRGLLVRKIENSGELIRYLHKYPINLLIQEYISLPNECGVFYYRLPGSEKGNIDSLTLKSYLSVKGNGFSTLEELIMYDKRASHYMKNWKKNYKGQLNSVPAKDEIIILSVIGNHIQGTQFINGNNLIDNELIEVFDKLTQSIPGWYYGRFDIKYDSIEKLKKGKDFIILEINGIISEPIHIYDPLHISYLESLKVLRQHWKTIYRIARINIKNGVKTTPPNTFVKDIIRLKRYIRKIKKLSAMPD